MQKNTLHLSALLLVVAVIKIALCLPGSVAQLRSAASNGVALTTGIVRPAKARAVPQKAAPVRQVAGPRHRNTRMQVASTERLVTPPPSYLQTLLDQSGIDAGKRPIAEAVLGLLAPACLEKLRTFSVLYNNPKHRGLAGNGVILVSGTVPDQEFIGLLMHEGLGHFRDITCLTGTPASGASTFLDGADLIFRDDPSVAFYEISWKNEHDRKASAARADFVTGYAYEGDNFEDLAESVTYYMTQESAFRERAAKNPILAQKLAWLEQYMPKSTPVAEGNSWDGEIAWDATKLAFTWVGN